jgi:hypothetical protein
LPPDVPSPYQGVRHHDEVNRCRIYGSRMGRGQFRSLKWSPVDLWGFWWTWRLKQNE